MRASLPNLLRPSEADPFTPAGFSEADRAEYFLLRLSDKRFASIRTDAEVSAEEAWLNFENEA